MSDVKSQMSDVRSQKSEVRSQKLIINIRIMEIRNGSIEASGGQAGAYARGLLMLNNAIDYKEPVFLPELMNDRKAGTGAIETKAEYLKVYPNPADKYITVEYRIENESENLVLKVADTESRVVYARKLANKEDSQLIDIKDFTQGSYIVYLEVDGKVVDSKIVSVTK